MHDLITCESKVQVVVALGRHEVLFALGRHEVLTNDTWHVLLQSENVFELGGITMQYVRGKEGFEFAEDTDMEINTEKVV